MKVEEIALRQEIRQMMNEAGINRNTLKEMVNEVIHEELKKACMNKLNEMNFDRNAEYIVNDQFRKTFRNEIHDAVRERIRCMNFNIQVQMNEQDHE